MKIGAAFPGQFLKAADLQGKRVQVTIESVDLEDIGGETKPVVHFMGKERGLVLNKTNSNAIWAIAGTDETDDWKGTVITLYPSKTDFQGKRVDCLRVDPPDVAPRRTPAPAPRRAPVPEPEPVDEGNAAQYDDDSVPFAAFVAPLAGLLLAGSRFLA